MNVKFFNSMFMAGVCFCMVEKVSGQASSIVTFSVDMSVQIGSSFTPGNDQVEAHGTFNGWGALTLVQQGDSTVYTNTANDTTDANGGTLQYKFVINGSNWENPATGQNRAARLPSNSGDPLVLPTAYFNDAGPNQDN